MPRIKPTTKIDVIGNLDLNPEKAVGDYIESKQQDTYFVKLRKRFIEVNSFIKDCVDKKRIAEKKVAEETAQHEILRSVITKYTRSIEELSKFREELKATVKEFEPYEKVLQEVVEKSDIFQSVKDCMDRCDALTFHLVLAQVEISALEQRKIQEIEEMRKRMVKVTNEAALTVLGLKNDLAELERSYNQARAECSKWEKILANAKNTVALHDLDKDRALDGIHYMYRLLCKRRNREPVFYRVDVENQLDYIKREIELLIEVHKEYMKRNARSKKSEYSSEKDMVKC
uniref:DUF4200 domain-containing protein n=1 Tax=Glossina morsitans morsitans TaxID=37546 RepID=A0A1B0G9U3_GLOMM